MPIKEEKVDKNLKRQRSWIYYAFSRLIIINSPQNNYYGLETVCMCMCAVCTPMRMFVCVCVNNL